MRPLEGRVAIVTCGGQGVGRAYARALAAAGAAVVVAEPSTAAGDETAASIEKDGGTARSIFLDVLDPSSHRAAVELAAAELGGLDVLVNNPARYGGTHFTALADLTVEEWDTTMTVMVRGVMLMCQAAAPVLAASPAPAIVNHTSSAAYGVTNWLDYAAARGAVIAMTKSLAKELAPLGIRVNAIAAGSLGIDAVALGVVEDEAVMLTTSDFQRQLIPRLGTEQDVAGPVVFLATEASSYLTGQTIACDGGKFFLG